MGICNTAKSSSPVGVVLSSPTIFPMVPLSSMCVRSVYCPRSWITSRRYSAVRSPSVTLYCQARTWQTISLMLFGLTTGNQISGATVSIIAPCSVRRMYSSPSPHMLISSTASRKDPPMRAERAAILSRVPVCSPASHFGGSPNNRSAVLTLIRLG